MTDEIDNKIKEVIARQYSNIFGEQIENIELMMEESKRFLYILDEVDKIKIEFLECLKAENKIKIESYIAGIKSISLSLLQLPDEFKANLLNYINLDAIKHFSNEKTEHDTKVELLKKEVESEIIKIIIKDEIAKNDK